jgi:hypothetical protein
MTLLLGPGIDASWVCLITLKRAESGREKELHGRSREVKSARGSPRRSPSPPLLSPPHPAVTQPSPSHPSRVSVATFCLRMAGRSLRWPSRVTQFRWNSPTLNVRPLLPFFHLSSIPTFLTSFLPSFLPSSRSLHFLESPFIPRSLNLLERPDSTSINDP